MSLARCPLRSALVVLVAAVHICSCDDAGQKRRAERVGRDSSGVWARLSTPDMVPGPDRAGHCRDTVTLGLSPVAMAPKLIHRINGKREVVGYLPYQLFRPAVFSGGGAESPCFLPGDLVVSWNGMSLGGVLLSTVAGTISEAREWRLGVVSLNGSQRTVVLSRLSKLGDKDFQ